MIDDVIDGESEDYFADSYIDEVMTWACAYADEIEQLHLLHEVISPFEGMPSISLPYDNGINCGLFIWFTLQEIPSEIQRDAIRFYNDMNGNESHYELLSITGRGSSAVAIEMIKQYLSLNKINVVVH